MFVLKNRIKTIPRNFTLFLDNSFHIVYYIHIPIGWTVIRHRKQKWKRKGQCIRRVLSHSFILSLSRAAFKHPPHRSVQGKSRSHGLFFSFAKQGTVPCSILRIPFFPNIIPEIEVNFWCQTTCYLTRVHSFRVDVPVWLIIQLISMVSNVKNCDNYYFHNCYNNKDFVIFYFMCK